MELRWIIIILMGAGILTLAVFGIIGLPRADPEPDTAGAVDPGFISLPPGFKAEIFADNLPGARSLAFGDNGTVFIGTRDRGVVYAIRDSDSSGSADRRWTIAEGLFMPNGVAFRNGSLYVAEVNRIIRFDDIENRLDNPPDAVSIYSSLPSDTAHGWKYIRFGPDGMLYIPVGMPCNICDPAEERYGTILRIHPNGSGAGIYARGIRNTVGFDWDPESGDLWFTENGRDWLGDDLPPDELNRAPVAGMHFGFPAYYGNCTENPEYAEKTHPADCVPPALNLPAHVAPLGMRFYSGTMFPEEYRNAIFIAEHGSWNRKTPIGYQVVTVQLHNGTTGPAVQFARGFLGTDGTVRGRPVDIGILSDGSIVISDDHAGRIYRVSWRATS